METAETSHKARLLEIRRGNLNLMVEKSALSGGWVNCSVQVINDTRDQVQEIKRLTRELRLADEIPPDLQEYLQELKQKTEEITSRFPADKIAASEGNRILQIYLGNLAHLELQRDSGNKSAAEIANIQIPSQEAEVRRILG